MQELMIRPTIYSFDNCRQFAEEFKLGKGDLLFTNKRLFKKFFEPLGLGCDVIFREDYGKGEPTDVMAEAIWKDVPKDAKLRILRHILPDCLSHHIRRLALTIILTEDHITAKPQRLKKFLKQSLIGKKQIPFTKFKFLRKLPAIIKTVNRRSDHQFLHSFSSCQPRISQKLFL